jgi:hypothetical protein
MWWSEIQQYLSTISSGVDMNKTTALSIFSCQGEFVIPLKEQN